MVAKTPKRLDEKDHKLLAIWAAECAEHVLPYFESVYPEDDRPRKAIEAARAWARGELSMVEARKAAFASHAAARGAKNATQAAARSAGHAAATAHVVTHAPHAADYAIKAVTAAMPTKDASSIEREWQVQHLPEHLHSVAFHPSRH